MERRLWLYPLVVAGAVSIVVVVAYFFALWVLNAVPRLRVALSLSGALFFEGLFILVLGIIVLSPMQHLMYIGGRARISRGPQHPKDDLPPQTTKKTGTTQTAIGLALVAAAITLIVLSLVGAQ